MSRQGDRSEGRDRLNGPLSVRREALYLATSARRSKRYRFGTWLHSLLRTVSASTTSCGHNWLVKGTLARKVHAVPNSREGTRLRQARHLAGGTVIDVLRQRSADSRVEIRIVADPDQRLYLVPADAVDAATARAMSIHRPPRHRRSSGGSRLPVDWKPPKDPAS